MGPSHTGNGENEAVLECLAKKSLCPEEAAFNHLLQCQKTQKSKTFFFSSSLEVDKSL